ncbi:MAG: PaaX family transcriptional regulator [Hylemonella sp.]|nr:PaaX family transcriptional regulator [Hylemonella sp.]
MPSAPELILDLLTVTQGDRLTAAEFVRAAEVFDIAGSTMRVGLTRLLALGKLARTTSNHYALSPQTHGLSREVTGWFEREAQLVDWCGQWLACEDSSLARTQRTAYAQHQRALGLLGFAALTPCLWVRPDNLIGGLAAAQQHAQDLGVGKIALLFQVAQFGQGAPEVNKLWPVNELERRYGQLHLAVETGMRRMERQAARTVARESMVLCRSVVRTLLRDPLLPSELASADARKALTQVTRDYQLKARRLWLGLIAETETNSDVSIT